MKMPAIFMLLALFIISTTGCEKQNAGGLSAVSVFIPNVFVPDSPDNYLFYVEAESENPNVELMVERMEIYDRYGNSIYKAEQFSPGDRNFAWDGTLRGDQVESGTYGYVISISDGVGSLDFVGDVTVL